jgi:tetratricopeptide (TPR) repeat protein
MIDKNRFYLFIAIGFVAGLSTGCFAPGKKAPRDALDVPPGLDKQTVVQANQVAGNNFVSAKQEQEAGKFAATGKQHLDKVDEFWKYLEQQVQQRSLGNAEQAQFDRELNQGAQALTKWKQLTNNGADKKKLQSALGYCEKAKAHLENAVRINPFDKNARALLAVAYYNMQNYFGQEKNYEKSVEILERLVRIERGEHELFRLLGENYLALGAYKRAVQHFNQGKTVLIKTSFEGPPPAATLYYYAYMLGDTYARMYNARTSLNMFQAALQFARSEQEKADVENYIKWIDWDGGNIRASERWDEIVALENTKDYKKMVGACEKMLPNLQTKEAKLAVHQKLAVVEFEFLDRKDQAVERMKRVFEAISPEQLQNPDERTAPILNTYGAMLYRLGVEARNRDERKTALAYFSKAATFKWHQMAKALIEMVTLVWNTPEQAVQYGEKALQLGENVLTQTEKCELLSLLVKACKSAGQYDKARDYFNTWKKCQEKT